MPWCWPPALKVPNGSVVGALDAARCSGEVPRMVVTIANLSVVLMVGMALDTGCIWPLP
jgi:hypothetical protein